MANIESAFFDLGTLDALAYKDSPIHRLDPRAKLVTTLIFIVTLVSHGRYEIAALLPYALFPVALITLADLPPGYLGKKLLLAAPFALCVGLFNPFFDQLPQGEVAGVAIGGGWFSFASIMLRFTLCVTAALVLIATTSFTGVCLALERLGAPRIFVLQLLFLYRYLFVLVDEGTRLARARALRSFAGRGHGPRVFTHLIGQLLLRTLARAQRIHLAMLCRGFDGEIRMTRTLRFGIAEAAFVLGWSGFFVLLRLTNLPLRFGELATRFLS